MFRSTLIALAAVAAVAPSAAQAASSPDLSVSRASLSVRGNTVSGSFTIRNGGRRAGRSTASLVVGARVLRRFSVPRLGRDGTFRVAVRVSRRNLSRVHTTFKVCADAGGAVRERSETNNCRIALDRRIPKTGGPTTTPTTTTTPASATPTTVPTTTPPTATTPPSDAPCSTPACAPVTVPATEKPFPITDAKGTYWAFVPTDYDQTNKTPTKLLVWLHGCGGESAGDTYNVGDYYPDKTYVTIAPDGADGGCWNMNTHPARVLTAIADAKARFNIDPRRVVIGGYSSGGDLSYRTAFSNADTFAGVLAVNTSPFRDTGSSQGASLAAAAWKFNVVHLAHTCDTTYDLAGVRSETDAMTAAGFPLQRIERKGHHYDPQNDEGPCDGLPLASQPSTDQDIQDVLIPHMGDDWVSPA